MSVTEQQVRRAQERFDRVYFEGVRRANQAPASDAQTFDEVVHDALEAVLCEQDPDWQRSRPCVVFGASLLQTPPDGAGWSAWFGGLSAEGRTPEEAMDNFDRAWRGEQVDPNEVTF